MHKRFLALLCIVPMLVYCDPKPVDPDEPDNPEEQVDPAEEIPDEIINGSTILVTNEVVEDFITNVTYPEHNYSETMIKGRKYKDWIVSPGQYDLPPQYSIRWKASDVTADNEVVVSVTEDGSGKVFEFKPADSETYYALVSGLMPNASYKYKATDTISGKVIKEGSFSTKGHLHQLSIKSRVRNARDLGGWKTKDGKTVKYRMVYRGGRLESSTLISVGVKQLKAEGIKAQLDLRGTSDVLSAPAADYLRFCAPVIEEGYTNMLKLPDPQNDPNNGMKLYGDKTKECFEYVVDCVRNNQPVYYHCSLGRDRTGTLTMILLGVLGVDEGDISKEYELTQFAPSGYSVSQGEKTQMTRLVDYKGAATYIWDNYAKDGKSFKEGVEACLLALGVSQKDIDDFRKIMLE